MQVFGYKFYYTQKEAHVSRKPNEFIIAFQIQNSQNKKAFRFGSLSCSQLEDVFKKAQPSSEKRFFAQITSTEKCGIYFDLELNKTAINDLAIHGYLINESTLVNN